MSGGSGPQRIVIGLHSGCIRAAFRCTRLHYVIRNANLLEVNPKGFIRLHSASKESLTVPYWASFGLFPSRLRRRGLNPDLLVVRVSRGFSGWQWASKGVIWPVWVSLGFFGLRSASFGFIIRNPISEDQGKSHCTLLICCHYWCLSGPFGLIQLQ